MDSKLFFKEIRKIIKEEIELALNKKNKIVEEVDFNNQIKEFQKMQEAIGSNTKAKSNGKLSISELLNETKNSMTNNFIDGDSNFKDIKFTSKDVSNFYQSRNFENVDMNTSNKNNVTGIEKALTRNYSELMKVIKNKEDKKR